MNEHDFTDTVYRDEPLELSPKDRASERYRRAVHLTHTMLGTLRDFLPHDRRTMQRMEEVIFKAAFLSNSAIINVPPEYDELNKMQIERKWLETVMAPITVPFK